MKSYDPTCTNSPVLLAALQKCQFSYVPDLTDCTASKGLLGGASDSQDISFKCLTCVVNSKEAVCLVEFLRRDLAN